MSTTTEKYGFIKPELTDAADITATNNNWDIIEKQFDSTVSTGNVLVANTDLDTIIMCGMYRIGNTPINAPTNTCDYGQLLVIHGGQDTIAQIVFPYRQSEAYFRTGNPPSLSGSQVAGKWNSWVKIADGDHNHNDEYLKLKGGTLSGALTVIDNFNINKTYDDVEYKTYVKPINYSINGNGNYSTGIIHYNNGVNDSQLMFNKDGVMFRDNMNAKAYKIYGQHNVTDVRSDSLNRTTKVNASDTNYTTLIARGTSLHNTETSPTVNGAICWQYE